VQPSLVARLTASLLLLLTLGAVPINAPRAGLAAGPALAQAPGALLPANRIVAYYGNPLSPILGRLGEGPPDEMIERLRQTVAYYAEADPSRPVKPALELITPLAQSGPGEDGLYRARMPDELIEEVAGWAADNELLLILDVQIGRSSVAEEVGVLLPYLSRPDIHLALDPEFAMGSSQVPGQAIGSLDGSEINTAIRMLAEVVEAEGLPPKVLIVHQFLPSMITNAELIDTDPRVQVVVVMDGFGGPAAKISKYTTFIRDAGLDFGGMKMFYKYDSPLLEPEEALGLEPPPDVIIYQ
jgi:hypothetical protein